MLREQLATKKVNWVVEADIKGFFNNLDHQKLLDMLRKRIDDEAFVQNPFPIPPQSRGIDIRPWIDS